MIVLDSSAVLAMLQGEAGTDRVTTAVAADVAALSAANLAEVLAVLSVRGGVALEETGWRCGSSTSRCCPSPPKSPWGAPRSRHVIREADCRLAIGSASQPDSSTDAACSPPIAHGSLSRLVVTSSRYDNGSPMIMKVVADEVDALEKRRAAKADQGAIDGFHSLELVGRVHLG